MTKHKYYILTMDGCPYCEELKNNMDLFENKDEIKLIDLESDEGISLLTSMDDPEEVISFGVPSALKISDDKKTSEKKFKLCNIIFKEDHKLGISCDDEKND